MRIRRLWTLLLSTALLGAAGCASAATPPGTAFAPTQLRAFPQDSLVLLRGEVRHELRIWLADTPDRQQQGLMFLTHLPAGYGMLFPLQPPRVMTMWMKNTYIPLDMLFIGTDGRIRRIAADTTPQSLDIISSGGIVAGVLEIAGGEAARLGLKVGDRVVHATLGAQAQP
jgi:hypothetical protein